MDEKNIDEMLELDSSTSSNEIFDDDIADPNFEIGTYNDSVLDGILCLNSDYEDDHTIVELNGPNIIDDSNDETDNISFDEPSTSTGIKKKKT